MYLFADVTKIYKNINSLNGHVVFQRDIDNLTK